MESWRSLARVLIGEPEFTSAEVAQMAAVDLGQARLLWRALGFPPVPDDHRVFSQSDVAMLQGVRLLLEEERAAPAVLIQLTRVTGQSLARIAEAQAGTTVDRLATIAEAPVDETVAALAKLVQSLIPNLEPFLGHVWRRHLLAALFRIVAGGASQSTNTPVLTVGFVDLVGFTAISQQLEAPELAALVERFEILAYEHIPERGGRVIKMIGDEVMFAAEDPVAAADIALALVAAYTGDVALPEVRAGLASGPTLSWEGDLFGPVVNLASRLVNLARPGTVLLSESRGELLRTNESFSLRHLRPLALKGIGRQRVWVLRRSAA